MNFKENLAFYLEENFVDELIDSLNETRVNSLILNTNKINKETFINLFPKVIPHSFLENVFFIIRKIMNLENHFYLQMVHITSWILQVCLLAIILKLMIMIKC